jgi:hypothetical protein
MLLPIKKKKKKKAEKKPIPKNGWWSGSRYRP